MHFQAINQKIPSENEAGTYPTLDNRNQGRQQLGM